MRLMALSFVGLAITACSIGETNYETITLQARELRETRTCESKFVVPDLSTLRACGTDGKSHCYPWAKTSVAKEELDECDDPAEICMPDKLLLAGGKAPKECTFGGSDKGACLPLAFKQIAKNAAALSKDVCEDDEKCVPCIHPIEKVDTGVCHESGVHEADCVGGLGEQGDVESCCAGLGVCVALSSVPEESRADATSMGCSGGTICAPAAMANEKPKRCETFGGFDGLCLPKCFAPMLQGADTSDDCNVFEVCLPCFIAEGQGMPGCE
jgi:hypothetical protein